MKIGVFDSGLGGLIITQSLVQFLPQYDYIYLGDTARVPYGNRSQEVIYDFTLSAVKRLFELDCQLIILACNTASADALRRIQQEYLPQFYPDRRVLGVIIPAAEVAAAQTKNGRIGVIATLGTITSGAYDRELRKLLPDVQIFSQPTPLLVPLVENDAAKYAPVILKDYLAPLVQSDIDTLVLGCTHYPMLKEQIKAIVGADVNLVSQDEIIPDKLRDYLSRHPEIAQKLGSGNTAQFLTTDLAPSTAAVAAQLFGKPIHLEKTSL